MYICVCVCVCDEMDISAKADQGRAAGVGGKSGVDPSVARRQASTTKVFISHKVFLKSFCRSELPHKSVNLSFTITNIKNKLADLCGN